MENVSDKVRKDFLAGRMSTSDVDKVMRNVQFGRRMKKKFVSKLSPKQLRKNSMLFGGVFSTLEAEELENFIEADQHGFDEFDALVRPYEAFVINPIAFRAAERFGQLEWQEAEQDSIGADLTEIHKEMILLAQLVGYDDDSAFNEDGRIE